MSRPRSETTNRKSGLSTHPGLPSLVHPCHFLSADTSLKLTSTYPEGIQPTRGVLYRSRQIENRPGVLPAATPWCKSCRDTRSGEGVGKLPRQIVDDLTGCCDTFYRWYEVWASLVQCRQEIPNVPMLSKAVKLKTPLDRLLGILYVSGERPVLVQRIMASSTATCVDSIAGHVGCSTGLVLAVRSSGENPHPLHKRRVCAGHIATSTILYRGRSRLQSSRAWRVHGGTAWTRDPTQAGADSRDSKSSFVPGVGI